MSVHVPEAGLVDLGLVLDIPSTIGVLKGVQRLLQVAVSYGDAGNHEGAAVATQGVLQMQDFMNRDCVLAFCHLLPAMVRQTSMGVQLLPPKESQYERPRVELGFV